MLKYYISSVIFYFLCIQTFAQQPIILTDSTTLISIGKQIDVLEDPREHLTFKQILSAQYQSQFKESNQKIPNYGIKQTAVWCRFIIKNLSDKDWVLNVDFPNLHSVILYQPVDENYIKQETGRSFAFRKRLIKNRSFIFPLQLKANEEKEFYLRIENHICVFPLYVGNMAAISEKQYPEDTFYGIYYGISFIIIFYALALFIATRERYYLYFFLQVIFLSLFSMIYCGEAVLWFPDFALPLTDYGTVIISLGIICVFLFFNAILKTKKNIPVASAILKGAALLIAVGIILYFIGLRAVSPVINMIGTFTVFFEAIILCFYLRREKIILLIFIGFCIGFAGIVFWVFMEKDIIPYSHLANNLFIIETMWWMIIFSIALELNINIYIKEKYQAQKELLINLEEKERLVLQQNEMLEQKVEERTKALKDAQLQLIQSEKMASLGELTAGIAHEIQNPLNFVNNFSEVSNELMDEMKDELNKGDINEAKFIADDIKQNLEKINHHGKRADAIVKAMLQHSRKSEGKMESTDINALCDEYLQLSYHSLRAKDKNFNADFKTDFDNTIGKINIIPQDIGRVLLNLFNNAFYATNEKKKLMANSYQPVAEVKTRRINDKVEIIVTDNGNGIPQNIVDKIFQPFFTTKPTGQGTGLGLSLSYDIVKAHGGEIKVKSKEGEGSEFVIQLPV
jgi:signal transduction histidine kinase